MRIVTPLGKLSFWSQACAVSDFWAICAGIAGILNEFSSMASEYDSFSEVFNKVHKFQSIKDTILICIDQL